MLKNSYEVSIKTLTDYHLESFISCPYRFYNQYILNEPNLPIHWRQVVQKVINKIVKDYFHLSIKEQNNLGLLKLIEQNWRTINVNIFENKIQYYIVLSKITDHLLRLLTSKETVTPPLFLYEKVHTYITELESAISITFEVGEWSKDTFILKKYLLDCDESLIMLYQYLSTVFSYKAFGVLPERIEMLSLLEGKKYIFYPTEQEISRGLNYLGFIKDWIKKPSRYKKMTSFNQCVKCPLNKQCEVEVIEEDDTFFDFPTLH
ncbi:hypothetical protein ACIFOT_25395 [Neobacillus sp. NRS-1170]|uniref:hypothetical protein n=1 Tax=Neobacillus sp. NRS-1170 TaxID=3233898 RepID=UPI003D2712F1